MRGRGGTFFEEDQGNVSSPPFNIFSCHRATRRIDIITARFGDFPFQVAHLASGATTGHRKSPLLPMISLVRPVAVSATDGSFASFQPPSERASERLIFFFFGCREKKRKKMKKILMMSGFRSHHRSLCLASYVRGSSA